MTLQVELGQEAEIELEDAHRWYEARRPGLGREFRASVKDVLDSISQFPRMYPIAHMQIRKAQVRHFPYNIYYILDDGVIVIVSIAHQRRNPRFWQSR